MGAPGTQEQIRWRKAGVAGWGGGHPALVDISAISEEHFKIQIGILKTNNFPFK
jgi:hypothetical protein